MPDTYYPSEDDLIEDDDLGSEGRATPEMIARLTARFNEDHDPRPADANQYGPISADEATSYLYVQQTGRQLRYAGSIENPMTYVLGHHAEADIDADLERAGGLGLDRVIGRTWEKCWRHHFTCPTNGQGDPTVCGCSRGGSMSAVFVPEGAPESYPVTVVLKRMVRPCPDCDAAMVARDGQGWLVCGQCGVKALGVGR
jgi:hypothetical protein